MGTAGKDPRHRIFFFSIGGLSPMASKIFLHYLVGVIDEKLGYSFRHNVIIPWLRHEVAANGPAFREIRDWTQEFAENEIDKFETIALTHLAEKLRQGKINLLDSILCAWPILLRGKRDGRINWHSLGFYDPDWHSRGFYSPVNICRLAKTTLMQIVSQVVVRLTHRMIGQNQTALPQPTRSIADMPKNIVRLADFSRRRSAGQPNHLGRIKP